MKTIDWDACALFAAIVLIIATLARCEEVKTTKAAEVQKVCLELTKDMTKCASVN